MKKQWLLIGIGVCLVMVALFASVAVGVRAQAGDDPNLVALGEALFYDPNLSVNRSESCATCHAPEVGFTGPDAFFNAHGSTYEGALGGRFGNRRPPTSAYAGESPVLHFDEARGLWVGGMFWDGRATGAVLGDPLAEQAQGPFLNPLEQAFPDAKQLVLRVAQSDYADLFKEVWGPGSLDPVKDVAGTYERIARSIAAYERSAEVNPFTSKFDLFWDHAVAAGKDVTKIRWPRMGGGGMGGGGMGGGGGMNDPYRWQNYRGLGLTDQELQGLASFNDPNRANCVFCHSLAPGEDGYPLFTDFSFQNVGVPKNLENEFYSLPTAWNPDGEAWVDQGLGAFLMSAGQTTEVYEAELGKFKVPTLRNVDLRPTEDFVKAYGHNGYFKSTEDIILFYAWRGLVMNGGLGMNGMGMDGCSGGMGGGMGGDMGMGGGMMEMMCDPNLFPQPEVNQNITPMNHFNMMDQANLATFLKTLSDGYFVR